MISIMRKFALIALCVLLAVVMCVGYIGAEGGENLVLNPSFESVDKSGEPSDWEVDNPIPIITKLEISDDMAVSGDKSLKISAKGANGRWEARVRQRVLVEPNKLYKVSLYHRKENIDADITVIIIDPEKKVNDNWVSISYGQTKIMEEANVKIVDRTIHLHGWEDKDWTVTLIDRGSDLAIGEWVEDWVIIKTPDQTGALLLSVGMKIWMVSDSVIKDGTLYIDDISVVEVQ
jgi:hypothetical protein